mmetsp:Transcript_59785/g.139257  ORF Transcript_59785/g.139257 Transcript_59785/m.139257 type:complete len:201 (+) Transcript_59785:498-1100(+)
MVPADLEESHGVFRVSFLLFDVHLQSGAVYKVEVLQLMLALLVPALDNLRTSHGICECMVRDEEVKLPALFRFNSVHVGADLVLQALAIGLELGVIHGMPPVGGVRADGLANGDVVVQLEDLESLVLCRFRVGLLLARVDRVALHARDGVEGLMHRRVEDAAARCKLALPLPVVGADVEHQERSGPLAHVLEHALTLRER